MSTPLAKKLATIKARKTMKPKYVFNIALKPGFNIKPCYTCLVCGKGVIFVGERENAEDRPMFCLGNKHYKVHHRASAVMSIYVPIGTFAIHGLDPQDFEASYKFFEKMTMVNGKAQGVNEKKGNPLFEKASLPKKKRRELISIKFNSTRQCKCEIKLERGCKTCTKKRKAIARSRRRKQKKERTAKEDNQPPPPETLTKKCRECDTMIAKRKQLCDMHREDVRKARNKRKVAAAKLNAASKKQKE